MGWHKFGNGMTAHFGSAYLFETTDGRPFIGILEKVSDTQGTVVVSNGVVQDFNGVVPEPVAFHELPTPYKYVNGRG